jgi:hypothetical protein
MSAGQPRYSQIIQAKTGDVIKQTPPCNQVATASHIVSGDEDLLMLHPFRGIPIVTPQGFVAQWEVE